MPTGKPNTGNVKRSKTNTGNATSARAKSTPAKSGAAKQATAKSSPAQRSTTGKQSTTGKAKQQGRQGAGPAPLRPIRTRQTRNQILATVAADTGVETRTVERVARSLSTTYTRHLIRGGSGQAEIPYLGAVIWRAEQAARPARTMMSPILGRVVNVPARKAQPVPRLRVHPTFRETVVR